jgi:hypothetical protein
VAGGTDTLIFSTETEAYSTTGKDSVVDLATDWKESEFNIIGDGGGSEAVFNKGASTTVKIAVTHGSSAAPACPANAGTTGETNNLTLKSCIERYYALDSVGRVGLSAHRPPASDRRWRREGSSEAPLVKTGISCIISALAGVPSSRKHNLTRKPRPQRGFSISRPSMTSSGHSLARLGGRVVMQRLQSRLRRFDSDPGTGCSAT